MELGRHLRELWRLRAGVGLAALLALYVAVSSVYRIGLLPPSLHPRSLEIAAASTSVLIDTPKSKVIDLNAETADFSALTTRTNLLGNIMASAPVRQFIARRAGVVPTRITAVAPITANVPRALKEPGSEQRATDILRSTDQYRLDIQANPTVPILNIYAQAPSAPEAERVANGAINGLRDYLHVLAARQGVPNAAQVQLEQLGRARGGVINRGVSIEVALLSFVIVFGVASAAVLFFARVRRGWRTAAVLERAGT